MRITCGEYESMSPCRAILRGAELTSIFFSSLFVWISLMLSSMRLL